MADKPQSGEGYLCSCGEKFLTKGVFLSHLRQAGRAEPGMHKSKGRVDMQTGEITLPPWNERTPEQQKQSRTAKKKDNPTGAKTTQPVRGTEILSNAMQLQFVPRIYTIDFSPIMRAAQEAAIRLWGWRADMPFGNFLDTCLFLWFKSCGVTLAGFSIDETPEEKEAREKAIAERTGGDGSKDKEPAVV